MPAIKRMQNTFISIYMSISYRDNPCWRRMGRTNFQVSSSLTPVVNGDTWKPPLNCSEIIPELQTLCTNHGLPIELFMYHLLHIECRNLHCLQPSNYPWSHETNHCPQPRNLLCTLQISSTINQLCGCVFCPIFKSQYGFVYS